MVSYRTQFFPPAAVFTETSLPDLRGKVYIVTGASAGVGRELARLLYSCNGTVYVAARSSERAHAAIQWAKDAHPSSSGALHFLQLDLGDLTTIRPSVEAFLAHETRLDVLFNNAGVMVPPQGSTTKQGYELQLGTNCVGPFLFTKLLTPVLARTAQESAAAGAVRVVWVSSLSASLDAPKGGVDMANLGYKVDKSKGFKYAVSKAGNILHALEFQRRYRDSGIVSVVCFPSPLPRHAILIDGCGNAFHILTEGHRQTLNPGNLASDLQRHLNKVETFVVARITHPPVNGAYTELFAGLSPEAAALKPNEWGASLPVSFSVNRRLHADAQAQLSRSAASVHCAPT
jgi:retinol dehydrogenase-12